MNPRKLVADNFRRMALQDDQNVRNKREWSCNNYKNNSRCSRTTKIAKLNLIGILAVLIAIAVPFYPMSTGVKYLIGYQNQQPSQLQQENPYQQFAQAFGQRDSNSHDGIHSTKTLNLSHNHGMSSFFLTAEDVSSTSFIAASGNNVYVVWVDNSTSRLGSQDILFAKSTDNGSSFEKPKDLSASLRGNSSIMGFSFSPQIAVSGSNVYVVWIESVYAPSQDRQDTDILFAKSIDGGNTFEGQADLSAGHSGVPGSASRSQVQQSTNPVITASGDDAYVAWTTHPLIPATSTEPGRVGNGDVFFTKIGAKGMASLEPINLSDNIGDSRSPRITSSGTNVYVAWTDNTRGNDEIYFKHISARGTVFAPTLNLSNNYLQNDKPQIAASGDNVYVAWQHFGKNENGTITAAILLESSRNNGTTFDFPEQVMPTRVNPLIGPLHHIAIGSDNMGNDSVYVTWSDGMLGNRDAYFSKSNGTRDTTNTANTTTTAMNNNNINNMTTKLFPYYYWILSKGIGESVLPEIGVSGRGHVVVVWMNNSTGHYDIYLRDADFTPNFASSSSSPTTLSLPTGLNGSSDNNASSGNEIDNSHNDTSVLFSNTINISNTKSNSMYPQIAVSGKNVYVAWVEEDVDNNGDGNSEIYFKRITIQ